MEYQRMAGKFLYKTSLALGVLLVLTVVGVIVYFHYDYQNTLNATKASMVSKAPINQVQTSNLQLEATTTGGCPPTVCYTLSGQIKNSSAYPFTMAVGPLDAYDCPTNTITADCAHIGQDIDVVLAVQGNNSYAEFAPNQVREASGFAELDGMPPVQGHFLWTYTITQLQEISLSNPLLFAQ